MRTTLFDNLPFAGPTPSMFTPEELAQPKLPNYSKKDVPMWHVEEDLLILQLVEQHGKKWAKIAAHLPGRTDNGVRNRWNRMERAQVIKSRRPAGAGYRCRRCGEPKRGHICAARTIREEDSNVELQVKAAALTELSAHAMQAIPAALPTHAAPPPSASPHVSPKHAPAPPPPLALAHTTLDATMATMASVDAATAALSSATALEATPLQPASPLHFASPPPLYASASAAMGVPSHAASAAAYVAPIAAAALSAPPAAAAAPPSAADYLRLSAGEVDEFLEELRRSLDDTAMGASAAHAAAAAAERQAALPPQLPPSAFSPGAFSPGAPGAFAPPWVSAASQASSAELPALAAAPTAFVQQQGGALFGPCPSASFSPPPIVSQRSLQLALSSLAADVSPQRVSSSDLGFAHAVFA